VSDRRISVTLVARPAAGDCFDARGGGSLPIIVALAQVDGYNSGMKWKWWAAIAVVLVGTLIAGAVVFLLGAVIATRDLYHARYEEERKFVEPILRGNPSYSAVDIYERSDGGISLVGEVASVGDRDRLRSELIRAIGEVRAEHAVGGVNVE
jgi:hypothetical protein